jgi:signal peptidase I
MSMKYSRRFFDFTFLRQERRQANILACVLFWSVLSYIGISRTVLSGAEVLGSSMVPTLADGDRVFLNRFSYLVETPRRGDIVAVDVPDYDGMCVKRIIALPGESVQIYDNRVIINGKSLDEPYLDRGVVTTSGALSTNTYQVAPNCYFVLGDNRGDSLDSREFGAVARTWIRGRVAGTGAVEYRY